jgi:hypothetical protein
MAIELNNQSVLIYNNVYLGNLIKAEISATPNIDTMNTIEDVTHKITIESIIPGGADESSYLVSSSTVNVTTPQLPDYNSGRTDDVLHAMRTVLSVPRRALYILNSGFGTTIIDGSPSITPLTRSDIETFLGNTLDDATELPDGKETYHKDLQMGPVPKVLRWEPIGGRGACRVVFEIEFRTRECLTWQDTYVPLGRISSYTYKTSYSLDDMYLTTRKISGLVKIHQNVQPALTNDIEVLNSSVDLLRDTVLFTFATPNNFRRRNSTFETNESKSELTFHLVDVENDSEEPYPAGVLDISCTQAIDSTGPKFAKWNNNLNCSITLKPNTPYVRAVEIFHLIATARLARSFKNGKRKKKTDENGTVTYTEHRVTPIPKKLRYSEKLFKRRARFDFSFSWLVTIGGSDNDISQIFLKTGLFSSIGADIGTTWSGWKSSIVDLDTDPRGLVSLRDNPNSLVVNSCINASGESIVSALNENQNAFESSLDDAPSYRDDSFSNVYQPAREDINEESSIMDYGNQIVMSTNSMTQEYQCSIDPVNSPDPSDPPSQGDETQSNNDGPGYYKGDGNQLIPNYSGGISSEQYAKKAGSKTHSIEISAPAVYLTVTGYSRRMIGPTPSPEILAVGGKDVECIADEYFSEKEDDYDLPVFVNAWRKVYRVLGTPKTFAMKTNGEINPTS